MLGMPLLIRPCWRSYLLPLCPVGSSRLYVRWVWKNQLPWRLYHWIHLWHILFLESCRCLGALLLFRTHVFPLGPPFQRRGCLFYHPLPGLPVRLRKWPGSEIRPLVLIQTSVVIEWVANSSLPSRHHPLCRVHLPSALAIIRISFILESLEILLF